MKKHHPLTPLTPFSPALNDTFLLTPENMHHRLIKETLKCIKQAACSFNTRCDNRTYIWSSEGQLEYVLFTATFILIHHLVALSFIIVY